MEFADHREYYAGDDLRHLDPHAYARLGRPYLKRFAADRALDVAILVDVSASMDYGQPSKLQVASRLAAALAYVAVSSGDRVRIASFGGGDEVRWRPAITSARHVSAVVENLEEPHAHTRAESDLAAVARKVRAMLSSSGMTVVLSDWWTPAPEAAIRAFARSGREAVAVQILAPEEEDPRLLADGPARLTDAERGRASTCTWTETYKLPTSVASKTGACASERLSTVCAASSSPCAATGPSRRCFSTTGGRQGS